MTVEAESLVGAWFLKEWLIEYEDGQTHHPFGNNALGQILYTQDGKMSATIMDSSRPDFAKASSRSVSESQKVAAFDSYFQYAGGWHIEGDVVVHTVEFSLNPDLVGTLQRRHVSFSGPRNLTLSATEEIAGKGVRRHCIHWFR